MLLRLLLVLCVGLASISIGAVSPWTPRPETNPRGPIGLKLNQESPHQHHYVMASLEQVTDWPLEERKLRTLAALGIEGVTIDMWWGLVEPEQGKFNWAYYLRYASLLKKVGLKMIPILAFHSAGGNVGDNVNIELGKWVWNVAPDMHFVSASGYVSNEYIQFGVPEAYDLYEAVMKSFAENFYEFREIIPKIYTGMGPAGEFRYPSFVPRAGWQYPGVGEHQAGSERMKSAFRRWLKTKYGGLAELQESWKISVSSWESISTPTDGENFYRSGVETAYGRDFLEWYQSHMEEHLFQMLSRARRVFLPFGQVTATEQDHLAHWTKGFFPLFYGPSVTRDMHKPTFTRERAWQDSQLYWHLRSVKWRTENPQSGKGFLVDGASLGVKLAGIHWQSQNPELPHAAERAAGYYRYEDIFGLIRVLGASLTFTCMEMEDNREAAGYPAYSTPNLLVKAVAEIASLMDLPLYGENALSIRNHKGGFVNAGKVLQQEEVHGFTLLRFADLLKPDGSPSKNAAWYMRHIQKRKRVQFEVLPNFSPDLLPDGWELRVVGPATELGGGNPAKGLLLTKNAQAKWTASTKLNVPYGPEFRIYAYHPESRNSAIVSPNYNADSTLLLGNTIVASVWHPSQNHKWEPKPTSCPLDQVQ